jgi:hypothetical protein
LTCDSTIGNVTTHEPGEGAGEKQAEPQTACDPRHRVSTVVGLEDAILMAVGHPSTIVDHE